MRVAADDKLHIIFGGNANLIDGQMPMFIIDLNQRTRICAGFDNVLNVKPDLYRPDASEYRYGFPLLRWRINSQESSLCF